MFFITTHADCLELNEMKPYLNGVLVVEGKSDQAFVSSFINTTFVVTNGYEIPAKDLDFLKQASKKTTIFVLTDSDEAGKQIRARVNKEIPETHNLYVDINRCNKKGKHGVAEADKDEIKNILKEYLSDKPIVNIAINLTDLINIGIDNKEKREKLTANFHLGQCNNKTLIQRMGVLGLTGKEIAEFMEKIDDNQ